MRALQTLERRFGLAIVRRLEARADPWHTQAVPHLAGPVTLPLGTDIPTVPAAIRQLGHSGAARRPPIDVYNAVMMALSGIFARGSARQGGVPVPVPQSQQRRPARAASQEPEAGAPRGDSG